MGCNHQATSGTGPVSGGLAITFSGDARLRPNSGRLSSQRALAGHLNRGIDGVFEFVRVVGGRFVSIAEVHAVVARAHPTQSEPEMACDRFGFLERHGCMKIVIGEHEQGVGQRPVGTRSLPESGS
jgi:hypothetical protein